MKVINNLFPKYLRDITSFYWTSEGSKEIECELIDISQSEARLKSNYSLPTKGTTGTLWRPFFPLFAANVIHINEDDFKIEFKEIGSQNTYRDEARELLSTLIEAKSSNSSALNPMYRRSYQSFVIRKLFSIEQHLPNIERRSFTTAEFQWTLNFEKEWKSIRTEVERVFNKVGVDEIPVGNDNLENWKTIVVGEKGKATKEAQCLFPVTSRLLNTVPDMVYSSFSILKPGTELDYHKANSRSFLRMHLGLIIPEGDLALQVENNKLTWEEGKVLIFDDFYPHFAWNKTNHTRIVLMVDFLRPMSLLQNIAIRLMNLTDRTKQQNIPEQWLSP